MEHGDGDGYRLRRGADRAKDQSYVLYVLGQAELARTRFPVGELTKAEVRARAAELGLVTADKPDSQDVCFVTTSGGRQAFLAPRTELHQGRVVGTDGALLGRVDAVELVTVGQRRGLGTGGGPRRYALSVDAGHRHRRRRHRRRPAHRQRRARRTCRGWPTASPEGGEVEAQSTAHGRPAPARLEGTTVVFAEPQRRVAPGQSVVLYRGDEVLGGGIAA